MFMLWLSLSAHAADTEDMTVQTASIESIDCSSSLLPERLRLLYCGSRTHITATHETLTDGEVWPFRWAHIDENGVLALGTEVSVGLSGVESLPQVGTSEMELTWHLGEVTAFEGQASGVVVEAGEVLHLTPDGGVAGGELQGGEGTTAWIDDLDGDGLSEDVVREGTDVWLILSGGEVELLPIAASYVSGAGGLAMVDLEGRVQVLADW